MKGVKFMIVDFTCVRKLFTPGLNPKSNITTQLPISRWEASRAAAVASIVLAAAII